MKARLPEIAEEVATRHDRLQITNNGRDYVMLLAAQDLESIEATSEPLNDPEAQQRINRAEEAVADGDVLDEKVVRALLARRAERMPE